MAKLVVNSESLVSVADAIREKGGTSEGLTFPQGFVDGIGAIESGGGGTEEIEQIIDASGVLESTDGTVEEKVEQLIEKSADENLWYEISETWASYQDRFKAAPIKKLPRLSFENATNFTNMCTGAMIETFDYYISNTKTITTYNYMFQNCRNLKFVKGLDVSQTANFASVFLSCENLETIQEPLNFQVATNLGNTFAMCKALKNISFVAETIIKNINFSDSAKLSAESVQSIIDGLAYVESTQNLTLSNKIVLTDNQKQVINAKGWTLIQ